MTILARLYASQGDPGDAVNISSLSVVNALLSGTGYSGIKLGSNGALSLRQPAGGWSVIPSQWLSKGTPSGFYVSMVIDSGLLTENAGAGPLQMNADRIYSITQPGLGLRVATITISISDDVSGSPVINSAQYMLEIEVGNL